MRLDAAAVVLERSELERWQAKECWGCVELGFCVESGLAARKRGSVAVFLFFFPSLFEWSRLDFRVVVCIC